MGRTLLIATLLLTTLSAVRGQSRSVGIRGGFSGSNFYNHNASHPIIVSGLYARAPYYETGLLKDLKSGFYAELFLSNEINPKLIVEYSLGYCQKGIDLHFESLSRIDGSGGTYATNTYRFVENVRLNYIVLPTTLQYFPGLKKRFYFLGGIYSAFAFKFNIKESKVFDSHLVYNNKGMVVTGSETGKHIDTAYASIYDAGIIGGGGYNFLRTAGWEIGLDARCSLGIVSIPRKFDEFQFLDFSSKTKNINGQLGVKILRSL